MALLRIDHVPETIKVTLPLYLLMPDPLDAARQPLQQRKVLYLLHGLSDDGSAWTRYTTLERVAAAYGLVVVMPSGGRSFYADMPNGQLYFSYLTEELPRYLENLFGLAPPRADTLIAGNSMGGYGAMKAAFHFPGRFAAAASFSGVLSLDFLRMFPDDQRKDEFAMIFGDLERLSGSPHDPAVWFKKAAQEKTDLPRLFISCGRQDDLYPLNQMVAAGLRQLGLPFEYHEADALHDWFFWDGEIHRFLAEVLGPRPV